MNHSKPGLSINNGDKTMLKKPIYFITGASGSGKTMVIPELLKICPEHITLDLDKLYGPLEDWDVIKNVWIHVANQMSLNNRVTILSGTFLPWDYEKTDMKDRFQPVFIGLHCNDEIREERLRARGWNDEMVRDHKEFNKWIVSHADQDFSPAMPLIDTSKASPWEVALQIKEYITATNVL
jgi:broad-specificity NMP kinase